ncbi:hypothetical protein JTE90_022249 [Oedothorax gibbosus]|uniref:Uncharacterized protein n=1 Tax=Oedothorax gibbosus TaxID=931172 RepID=A0AAV6VXS3_9ARAC|nr:hypothetical protein JTE90_022249 [Oedothorax gibbosus]
MGEDNKMADPLPNRCKKGNSKACVLQKWEAELLDRPSPGPHLKAAFFFHFRFVRLATLLISLLSIQRNAAGNTGWVLKFGGDFIQRGECQNHTIFHSDFARSTYLKPSQIQISIPFVQYLNHSFQVDDSNKFKQSRKNIISRKIVISKFQILLNSGRAPAELLGRDSLSRRSRTSRQHKYRRKIDVDKQNESGDNRNHKAASSLEQTKKSTLSDIYPATRTFYPFTKLRMWRYVMEEPVGTGRN